MSGSGFKKGDLAVTTHEHAGSGAFDGQTGPLGESVPVRILEDARGEEAIKVEALLHRSRWYVAQVWLRKIEP